MGPSFYLLQKKKSALKVKTITPNGSKFFSFRGDLFSEGLLCSGKQITKVVSLVKTCRKTVRLLTTSILDTTPDPLC